MSAPSAIRSKWEPAAVSSACHTMLAYLSSISKPRNVLHQFLPRIGLPIHRLMTLHHYSAGKVIKAEDHILDSFVSEQFCHVY